MNKKELEAHRRLLIDLCKMQYLNLKKKQDRIDELQQRIDKAIEYINKWVVDEYSIAIIDEEDENACYNEPDAKDKLLEILGDKENE